MADRESLGVFRFWQALEVVAWFACLVTALAAVIVLVRPHDGPRGPIHWEAAAILLFVSVGMDVLASLAHFTCEALNRD